MAQAVVGITETCERLGTFQGRIGDKSAHDRAAEYIGTLPKHESGIYYIDLIQHPRFYIKHIEPKNPKEVKV